jgi:hypothetical protein
MDEVRLVGEPTAVPTADDSIDTGAGDRARFGEWPMAFLGGGGDRAMERRIGGGGERPVMRILVGAGDRARLIGGGGDRVFFRVGSARARGAGDRALAVSLVGAGERDR